jgi:hypothetical protein
VQLAATALSYAFAKSAMANGLSIHRLHLSSQHCRTGYPAKAIAKNFASLITYPHSESKRFENRSG